MAALSILSFGIRADAATGINEQISFQGKVVNANGTNVANGSYTFVFRLYDVDTGGTHIWTESKSLTVTDGIFQTNLGDATALPGSIDFNTDNIYLGINFNSDGEMSPRVRFTAAPYAFNAKKVGGLTVTDTTGTLTIPNAETISFGGSFSTTASNDIALTTSGATTLTLPTTGTLATLAGGEVLTNKTIGSTGLTFSGATTDITTASGEDLTVVANGAGVIVLNDAVTTGALTISGATTDITTASGESLVIVANGAGVVDIQDATTVDSLTADTGGVSIAAGQSYTGTGAVTLSSGGSSGLTLDSASGRVTVATGDFLSVSVSGVSGAVAGDIWYDSAAQKFKVNENGSTKILCNTTDLGCGSGGGMSIGGTVTSGTTGSILFIGASAALAQDNANFFFDDTNNRLGIGDTTPDATLDFDFTSTSGTAASEYGSYFTVSDTGATSSGTDATYGNRTTVTRSGATGGTLNTYGQYAEADGTFASGSGTTSTYGLYGSAIGNANGNSFTYGVFGRAFGTDTTTGGYFNAFGGATSIYGVRSDVYDNGDLVGTAYGVDISIIADNSITTAYGLNASVSGSLGTIDTGYGVYIANVGATTDYGIYQAGSNDDNILFGATNIGGDTTPNALFTVGNTSQFQVNSSGAIAATTGITSSGTITFSGLSTAGIVTNTAGGVLGTTATVPLANGGTNKNLTASNGAIAYSDADSFELSAVGTSGQALISGGAGTPTWYAPTAGSVLFAGTSGILQQDNANFFFDDTNNRLGIGDATPDAVLDLDFTSTNGTAGVEYGSYFTVSDTGAVSTGVESTYGNRTSVTRSGATGGTVSTYGQYLNVTGTFASGTGNIATYGLYSTVNGDTVGTATAYGAYASGDNADQNYGGYFSANGPAATGVSTQAYPRAGSGIGLDVYIEQLSTTTANTNTGLNLVLTDGFDIASGTDTTYGVNAVISRTGATTGTINNYGLNIDLTGDTGGTSANYGAYVNVSGADTNYSGIFTGGNFGIGDTTPTALFTVGSGDLFQVNSSGAIAATTGITSSGAIAANGGITFDASTDTVGAFTAAGTIDMSAQILTNIGNTGTDFVASTGALTLAGVLTANGGITLASSQTFTASSLSYMDLGAITHGTTAVQGLRLPQAASASPSSPTSGEGYLAWDAGGNQVIYYNGSAWATFGAGGGYNLIKDESTGLTARTTLAFLGAGVSCADNASQTECTISGGAGSDLQGTYDTDADGSNATISLTAADDGLVFTNPASGGNNLSAFLLSLTQQHTTDAIVVLDMVQSSNEANGANLTANSIDTETGLAITTNGLTSGKGISIASSSTAFTGNLADVQLTGSNAANTGNVLAVSNTGTANTNTSVFVDHRATGTGNLAMRVNDESGDTTPFIIDGAGNVGIGTSSITTPTGKLTPGLQVGSATNRENSSFYGDVTAEGFDIRRNLTGIIDIFVYDTSRDADGGEWRSNALSQQLSWFTETKDNTGSACVIGTDDRCGKSEFPRKAILVTTATALHIFDGGDNTLWMSFTQAGTYAMGADTNNNPSGVGAQNGVVVVGTNGASATGMYAFDFKQDTMFRYNATNRVQGDKNIANRNSTVTYSTDANTNFAIADAAVNDVSIAMQTASSEGMANTLTLPTDSATSPVRGITLVAAATNTAISVVNMASRKTLNYSDVTNDDYYQVVMTTRGRLYATNATQQQLEEWRNIDRDVVNETNGTPDRTYDELTPTGAAGKTPITTGTAPTFSAANPGQLAVIERSSSARESAATTLLESGDIVFVGSNQGLAEVHTSGGNLLGASWSKITTTTTATPYMVGAPRGVFTFDEAAGATAATSAVGTAASTKQVLDQAGATAPTFGGGGVRGTSVNFNNNSYLCSDANSDGTCDADAEFNAGTIGFTVSLWFKHGTVAAADALFERCYTPATPTAAVGCIYAGMTASGTIRFAIDSQTTWTYDTTYDDTIVSTGTYNDNQWHHAVFTNTDTDICMYIDGKMAVACDSTLAATATLDASQVLTVGGVCSGANCTTGTNFWDGSIDDFVWSSNGATTDNGLPAQGALKLYLDGRAHLIRPSATVTDATAVSSTTIGDSGESYTPGSFAGLVVELTGGTGSGQTRMIVSNDATTLTVSPAWSTTPDTTTDYQVSPARLYGTTNNVTAIAPDLPTNLNRIRKVYVGTSDGSDGGGVTVYTNAGTGSLKTAVIHSDAGYPSDDLGSSWSGTDADDISAMQVYSDTVAIGNGAFMRAQRSDVGLKQLQLDIGSAIEDIRQELVAKQLYGSTQDVLGLGQGADLAERYYSNESLEAGEIVSIDKTQEAGVKRSVSAYQRDVLGIVATKPAITLGAVQENAYPVALAGRVPVKVTNENGPIYAGDRITASSRPGYGMFASQAGRVIGTALADAGDWIICPGEDMAAERPRKCTTVLVFVNLSDYYGQPVELAMAEREKSDTAAAALETAAGDEEVGITGEGASVRLATAAPTREEKLLAFLREIRDERAQSAAGQSEVFTDRVAASSEVVTPRLIADEIWAKSIKADSIEGLAIWTNQIASLEAKYAGLNASLAADTTSNSDIDAPMATEKTLLNLEKFSVGSIAVALDANILGKLSVTGALRVIDAAEFQGETTFASLVSFLGDTVFSGKVAFSEAPTFSANTAGFATIAEGRKKVRVEFTKAYEKQPIVTVALTRDTSPLLDDKADEELRADVAALEKDFAESVFGSDVRYMVTEKDATGFTILLAEDAPTDLSFSWVAIAVKGAKTFESGKAEESKTEVSPAEPESTLPSAGEPVITPSETPPTTESPDASETVPIAI